jgi:hypothetical protein
MTHSNNINPALKELSAQYYKRDIGVMFANRIKDGQLTDEECVTFAVKEKLPLDQISSEDVLPSFVIVDNKYYPTDVIVLSNASTLNCPTQCIAWQTTPPGNRNTVRPLKGGVSIGAKNNIVSPTECKKGTLGFIAVDRASQALVGVTAGHVVVKNQFMTMNQDLTKIAQNEKDNYVYQNGETCTANPALQIGQVIRYVPLYVPAVPTVNPNYFNFSIFNRVDGALISLKESDVSNTESFKQYGVDYNLPLPFATSPEIYSLNQSIPLYMSGRTTGAAEGDCNLYYYTLYNDQILVNGYDLQGADSGSLFSSVIIFLGKYVGCSAAEPGDSGAALVADFNGVRKIVGLVFGQAVINNGTPVGLACRIDWVAEQLGIQAWDGTPKNFINELTIKYTTVPGKSYDSVIKKNNKIYWQVGLSSLSTTTTTTTII